MNCPGGVLAIPEVFSWGRSGKNLVFFWAVALMLTHLRLGSDQDRIRLDHGPGVISLSLAVQPNGANVDAMTACIVA